MLNSYICSVGAYYPKLKVNNQNKENVEFLKRNGEPFNKTSADIVAKFEQITGIVERKIARVEIKPSDMGFFAAENAIEKASIDKETIDYIIVAHNWGDTYSHHNYSDLLPNLAARIKNKLEISNPNCVAYDILFGCPGWVEGMKQADLLIKTGEANRVLVIGTDAVSRVVEECDMDSMLFSDGAGAVIIEATDKKSGILAHKTVSHCNEELDFLTMDSSYDLSKKEDGFLLKMQGKQVFKYAMENVPKVIIECLKKANLSINDIEYFLLHQANGKMIRMIGKKLFQNFGKEFDESKMPINVETMGNNSVATIPTLLYELENKKLNSRGILKGDNIVFASVGAGMHANCLIHKF